MAIFNMVGCGGGSSLNYEVVGGTSAPSSPSENTIWINTSTTITSHVFSATEPENPVSGMAWISVGASSTVAFSVTEENPVMVYPLSAKQYVSGAWVDKTPKIYQNGAWSDWVTYVVNNGVVENFGFSTSARSDIQVGVTSESGYINAANSSSSSSTGITTDEKVDLTNLSMITIDIDVTTCGTDAGNDAFAGVSLLVMNGTRLSSASKLYDAVVSYAVTKTTGRQTLMLDVSAISGAYYIGLGLGYPNSAAKVYNLYYS